MYYNILNGSPHEIGFRTNISIHKLFPIIDCYENNTQCIVFTKYGLWSFMLYKYQYQKYNDIIAYLKSYNYKLMYKFIPYKYQVNYHIDTIIEKFKKNNIKIDFYSINNFNKFKLLNNDMKLIFNNLNM